MDGQEIWKDVDIKRLVSTLSQITKTKQQQQKAGLQNTHKILKNQQWKKNAAQS